MSIRPDILCIGSVLWDIIGRAERPMAHGDDRPGRIRRQPGGVALNIALALNRFGLTPALLSSVGRDAAGTELLAFCGAQGLVTEHVHVSPDWPTDCYMAVEDTEGLVAALADAHSLEAAGAAILAPLADGRLGSAAAPYAGPVALDGNLTEALLAEIVASPLFAAADLRVAPASPGKAMRLRPLLRHEGATLYVNLSEARQLSGTDAPCAATAAEALLAAGASRVVVTDGGRLAAKAGAFGVLRQLPPRVSVAQVTGAGDTCMAAHIAAEQRGAAPGEALRHAVETAAAFVAGRTGP